MFYIIIYFCFIYFFIYYRFSIGGFRKIKQLRLKISDSNE